MWVGIIFYFSGTPGITSHKESIKFAGMLMDIDFIKTAFKSLKGNNIDFIVRKNAHAFEYIVLAILTSAIVSNLKLKRGSSIIHILFICQFLAVLDEFHQSFVPGRGSLVSDVLIDTAGAAIGIALYYIFYNIIYKGLFQKFAKKRY